MLISFILINRNKVMENLRICFFLGCNRKDRPASGCQLCDWSTWRLKSKTCQSIMVNAVLMTLNLDTVTRFRMCAPCNPNYRLSVLLVTKCAAWTLGGLIAF